MSLTADEVLQDVRETLFEWLDGSYHQYGLEQFKAELSYRMVNKGRDVYLYLGSEGSRQRFAINITVEELP